MGNRLKGISNEEDATNKRLDRQAKEQRNEYDRITRVLLLGTGDSGKSTIFKQARQLRGGGYNNEDRIVFRALIFENIMREMQKLIEVRRNQDLALTTPGLDKVEEEILRSQIAQDGVTAQLAEYLTALWNDEGMKKAWQMRHMKNSQVLECLGYFMRPDVLTRITKGKSKYLPTFEDILRCRFRTTGVITQGFTMQDVAFQLIDVGGQRSERKKWISYFSNVSVVLFVVAISEFDEHLYEATSERRVDEALKVWRETVNREDFRTIGFLLFLNKNDLFENKLKKLPFRITEDAEPTNDSRMFPRNVDYTGPEPKDFPEGSPEQKNAVEQCAEYVKEEFKSVTVDDRRGGISTHFTVATDSKNFEHVFDACLSQILRSVFESVHVV